MPITRSAKKALRQNVRRRKLNQRYKRNFRVLIKDFRKAARADAGKAKEMLPSIYKALDKASKHGTIKKNTGSRYKSRLTKFLSKTA